MGTNESQPGDGVVAVPRIDHTDPLPSVPEPKGRWAVPYISDRTGQPTVYTRRPLQPPEVRFGLRSCLSADTLERLKVLMSEEDEKYERYVLRQDSRPDAR
ncbi:hypothetical protein [Actinomadura sp. 9N215]|uniref:hypothetical protein n=1 Tax=Actinomadura sp. 9N215 TaxID=3375150 RepID=UPI0037A37FFC